jgi:peptidoglycan-associated lipoprotein
MIYSKFSLYALLLMAGLTAVACQRSSYDVWEDTKTCSRQVGRGFRSLGGKHGDSRAVYDPSEFYVDEEGNYVPMPMNQQEPEYIPLADSPQGNQMEMTHLSSTPQPRETPGDPGSSIPGIEAFKDPSTVPEFAQIFQNVYFEYNSSLVKGKENLDRVHTIADYMKSHPQIYLFVEGHCDERGPEAYNLALGSRRGNTVRDMLIEQGVNPNNVFTISYGKERPLVLEHHEEGWSKNRRAEFKIYRR